MMLMMMMTSTTTTIDDSWERRRCEMGGVPLVVMNSCIETQGGGRDSGALVADVVAAAVAL